MVVCGGGARGPAGGRGAGDGEGAEQEKTKVPFTQQLILTYVNRLYGTAGAFGQSCNGITVGLGTLEVGIDWPHKHKPAGLRQAVAYNFVKQKHTIFTSLPHLKGPKHEIFESGFFT